MSKNLHPFCGQPYVETFILVRDTSPEDVITLLHRLVSGNDVDERKLLVSGSLVDLSCLTHRLIGFAGTLCRTLCPLPDLQVLQTTTERDRHVIQTLLRTRKEILDKLLQVLQK